jgi:hypothetical protein
MFRQFEGPAEDSRGLCHAWGATIRQSDATVPARSGQVALIATTDSFRVLS